YAHAKQEARRDRTAVSLEPLDRRLMMAVTATFANGVLTVMGDDNDNDIKLFFAANGTIQVNADTIIIPTPATRTNTTLIQIFGQGGDDKLIWSGSANLPAARVDGGDGRDTITSGTFNDTLVGGADDDTYLFDGDGVAGSDTVDESGGGFDT